eukprot:CAMPEP_0183350184 /NCGR_PEP_ID=MMETSP0164_2-20130417/17672_1 /TAXON_ID=221442 /ORGANISM="Coccolithus pelagicus ssp braarudi, Strain PLY182g" /LENGTH=63 /DNA_ID=CAMNT_0025522063 /DNA_START=184 /DNA_END=375 /DNA_ORIENTATION=-
MPCLRPLASRSIFGHGEGRVGVTPPKALQVSRSVLEEGSPCAAVCPCADCMLFLSMKIEAMAA